MATPSGGGRKGPRIIGNVQIAPPRQSIDFDAMSGSSQTDLAQWGVAGGGRRNKVIKDKSTATPLNHNERRNVIPCMREETPTFRKRPHRNAVVTIKVEDGGPSYVEILKKARENINIKEIEIINPKIRRTANGGVLLEIPGADGHQRADELAHRLKSEIGNDAKIGRPVKFGELRIVGLDLSVTPEELANTIVEHGKCDISSVNLGPFRESERGVRTVWVRCPLTTAFILAERQRIEVGWSSAKVEILKARPIQCYKCWEYGHIRNACKATIDRQGHCFNCGSVEHKLMDCKAPSHCVVCKEKGLPFKHKLGSLACGSLANASRNRQIGVGNRTNTGNIGNGYN